MIAPRTTAKSVEITAMVSEFRKGLDQRVVAGGLNIVFRGEAAPDDVAATARVVEGKDHQNDDWRVKEKGGEKEKHLQLSLARIVKRDRGGPCGV